MYSKEVQVTNQVGLYARPATFFIQKANEFKSTILVEKEERLQHHPRLSLDHWHHQGHDHQPDRRRPG